MFSMAREELALIWPRLLDTDSELQRNRKKAIRSGHGAMAVQVGTANGVTIAVGYKELSASQAALLIGVGLVYLALSLQGTRDAVRFSLQDHGPLPQPLSRSGGAFGAFIYFSALLVLAEVMFFLAKEVHPPGLMWLVLLVPIGLSALVTRSGRWLVTLASTLIYSVNTEWIAWWPPPSDMISFLLGVVFTHVFCQIALSEAKARGDAERLRFYTRAHRRPLHRHSSGHGRAACFNSSKFMRAYWAVVFKLRWPSQSAMAFKPTPRR
jgi:hypothetical protein